MLAPPIPSSTTSTTKTVGISVDANRRGVGVGVLPDVGQGLADDVVRGDLDRFRKPLGEADAKADRHRGARRQRFQGDGQAVPAQHGRVDAAGDVAELVQGGRHLFSGSAPGAA